MPSARRCTSARRRSAWCCSASSCVLAVFAPLIAPYEPNEVLLGTGVQVRERPCIHLFGCDDSEPQHILGIDGNGRDEFSRIVYGARLSLLVGPVGRGHRADDRHDHRPDRRLLRRDGSTACSMRCMDVLLAFPALLLAIFIVTVLGRGLLNAVIAISLVTIPVYARVVRSSVLTIREQDFVAADRALGVTLGSHPAPPRAAELAHAARRAGHPRRRHRGARGGGAVVPRPRRAGADRRVGLDAGLRAQPGLHRHPPRAVPGHHDHDQRAGLQPHRRRPPRRPRPAARTGEDSTRRSSTSAA